MSMQQQNIIMQKTQMHIFCHILYFRIISYIIDILRNRLVKIFECQDREQPQ